MLLSQGLKRGEASLAACKGGAFLTSGLGTRIKPTQASGQGQRAVWLGDQADNKEVRMRDLA